MDDRVHLLCADTSQENATEPSSPRGWNVLRSSAAPLNGLVSEAESSNYIRHINKLWPEGLAQETMNSQHCGRPRV